MGGDGSQQLLQFALAVHFYAVFLQQRRRDAVAVRQRSGERSVIDASAAAGGASLLQHGGGTAVQPRQTQRLLRAPVVFRRHVSAIVHHHLVPPPFGGISGRRQPAQLLRAHRHRQSTPDQLLCQRVGLALPLSLIHI